MRMSRKSENRTVRAVTRSFLNSGKTTKFVDDVREERWQQWSGKRVLLRLALVYLALAGVVGISQFVLMESVKNPSFSLGTCQTLLRSVTDNESRATVIVSCSQAFEWQQNQAMWAQNVNRVIGWVNPFTYAIYGSFFDVNIRNLAFEKQLFLIAAKDPKPTVANVSKPWTYKYVTVSIPEDDVGKLNQTIQAYAGQGFHVVDMYHAKIDGTWVTVVTFELVIQP